jgi:hydrogenase maturation protease
MTSSILIVGIGNVLLGDEGLGSHILERLENLNLPDSVTLLNCGTDLLSMQNFYAAQSRIIILDAIQAGRKPGTLHCIREYDFDRFLRKPESAHQLSAIEAVLLLKKMFLEYAKAEFIFLGIEPASTSIGQELSPAVEAAIPFLLEEIKKLLQIEEDSA